MDSALSSPCRLLLPLPPPSMRRRRPNGAKSAGDHGGAGCRGAAARRVRAWRRRNADRFRASALFGDGGDELRAMRRMLKLASAYQNRSVRELLELAGDECQYLLSNLASISFSQMGKNMFLFLHTMMLRHHVSFVLKPTEDEGFDLGVKWSLEWKGRKLPWDLDCNVSTTHVYRGLLLISQVNKTCVPLLQEILRIIHQNLDDVVLTVANKILPEGTLVEKNCRTIIASAVMGLVVMVLFYVIFQNF